MKDLLTILAPSLVGWLGYLWVKLIKDMVDDSEDSPLAKILNAINGVVGELVLLPMFFFLFGFPVAIIALCVRMGYQPIVSMPTLLSFGLAGAQIVSIGALWSYRKWKIGSKIQRWFARYVDRYRNSDQALLKRADRRVKQLCDIVPYDNDLRLSLGNIANNTLPLLLKRRREMQHAVRRIGELITRSEKSTLTEFSEAHLQHVIAHKRIAEQELETTNKEIEACLDSLELFEADLLMANASGDSTPVTRQLSELQERIANIASSNTEIERYLDRRPDSAK